MASGASDQLALFNQYDNEYCTKATDVARKIEAVSSLSGGMKGKIDMLAVLAGIRARGREVLGVIALVGPGKESRILFDAIVSSCLEDNFWMGLGFLVDLLALAAMKRSRNLGFSVDRPKEGQGPRSGNGAEGGRASGMHLHWSFLSSLIVQYTSSIPLRNYCSLAISQGSLSSKNASQVFFSHAAPQLWGNLSQILDDVIIVKGVAKNSTVSH